MEYSSIACADGISAHQVITLMNTTHPAKWVWLQAMLVALALVPLIKAVLDLDGLQVVNPIQFLQRTTGRWALNFLLFTLCVTPLRRIFDWSWLVRFRRTLGLLSFLYAILHLAIYTVLDRGLDFKDIAFDVTERPAILAGILVFAMLVPLAVTSTSSAQRRLGGKAWKRLHRLIYPACATAIVHFFLLIKIDLSKPLLYGGIATLLLGWRAANAWHKPAGKPKLKEAE
jgi:methionine sulfoxide reductase heme-binding subunit